MARYFSRTTNIRSVQSRSVHRSVDRNDATETGRFAIADISFFIRRRNSRRNRRLNGNLSYLPASRAKLPQSSAYACSFRKYEFISPHTAGLHVSLDGTACFSSCVWRARQRLRVRTHAHTHASTRICTHARMCLRACCNQSVVSTDNIYACVQRRMPCPYYVNHQ